MTHGLAAVLFCLLLLTPTAAQAAEPGRLVISARLGGGASRTVSASVTIGRDGRPRGTFRYVDRPASVRVVSERLESALIGTDEATLNGFASLNRGRAQRFQLVVREGDDGRPAHLSLDLFDADGSAARVDEDVDGGMVQLGGRDARPTVRAARPEERARNDDRNVMASLQSALESALDAGPSPATAPIGPRATRALPAATASPTGADDPLELVSRLAAAMAAAGPTPTPVGPTPFARPRAGPPRASQPPAPIVVPVPVARGALPTTIATAVATPTATPADALGELRSRAGQTALRWIQRLQGAQETAEHPEPAPWSVPFPILSQLAAAADGVAATLDGPLESRPVIVSDGDLVHALTHLSAEQVGGVDGRLPIALRVAGTAPTGGSVPPDAGAGAPLSPLRSTTVGLPRRGPGSDGLPRLPAQISLAMVNPDGTLGPLDAASSDAVRRVGYAALRAAGQLEARSDGPSSSDARGTSAAPPPGGPKRDMVLVVSGRDDGAGHPSAPMVASLIDPSVVAAAARALPPMAGTVPPRVGIAALPTAPASRPAPLAQPPPVAPTAIANHPSAISTARAEPPPLARLPTITARPSVQTDFDLPGGHFYRQAGGDGLRGYAVTDADGVRFWSELRRLGGVEALGYPASRRFEWDGFTVQVFQRAILQWNADQQAVTVVNVFDLLGQRGLDDWLLVSRQTPPSRGFAGDQGTWSDAVADHLSVLTGRPSIGATYFGSRGDPMLLYGLPVSDVVDMGNHYALRTQRAVFQEWKENVPWARPGQVTIALGGDIAKEAGILPDAGALAPVYWNPGVPLR